MNTLQKQLFELQDLKYRDFHSKLIPGYNKENIIGIRTPNLLKNMQKLKIQNLLLKICHIHITRKIIFI